MTDELFDRKVYKAKDRPPHLRGRGRPKAQQIGRCVSCMRQVKVHKGKPVWHIYSGHACHGTEFLAEFVVGRP